MPHKLATNKAEQCLGFSKDHRQCRLIRRSGERTCAIHKHYFSDWISNHCHFYKWEWLSKRQKAEFQFQLSNGYVQISQEHVCRLNHTHLDYYLKLVDYAKIPVEWNMVLLHTAVYRILDEVLKQTERTVNLSYFLQTPRNCILTLTALLRSLVSKTVLYRLAEGQWMPLTRLVSVWFECTIINAEWEQLLWSQELRTCFRDELEVCLQDPSNTLLVAVGRSIVKPLYDEWIPLFHSTFASRHKERMSLIKEELVAQAWHPRRVEKWVEAGCILEDL